MIGSKTVKNRIEELLKEIAHNNQQKYGYIIDKTDCGSALITLGYGKNGYDNTISYKLSFNIIFGDIVDIHGNTFKHIPYEYFELSSDFEKDMEEELQSIIEEGDTTIEEEDKTIERLEAYVNGTFQEFKETLIRVNPNYNKRNFVDFENEDFVLVDNKIFVRFARIFESIEDSDSIESLKVILGADLDYIVATYLE